MPVRTGRPGGAALPPMPRRHLHHLQRRRLADVPTRAFSSGANLTTLARLGEMTHEGDFQSAARDFGGRFGAMVRTGGLAAGRLPRGHARAHDPRQHHRHLQDGRASAATTPRRRTRSPAWTAGRGRGSLPTRAFPLQPRRRAGPMRRDQPAHPAGVRDARRSLLRAARGRGRGAGGPCAPASALEPRGSGRVRGRDGRRRQRSIPRRSGRASWMRCCFRRVRNRRDRARWTC